MGVALGVVALGTVAAKTVMQVKANKKARKAQIEAAEKEAQFMEAQARRTEKVKQRQLELLELERNEIFGDQVNAIAQNNIDLSGSALKEVINTQLQIDDERAAIIEENDFDIQLARLRAREQRLGAERIRKAGKMQDIGTILGGVSSFASTGVGIFAGTGSRPTGGTSTGSGASTGVAKSGTFGRKVDNTRVRGPVQ